MPSANRITLLRDADGDGVAEIRSVFLQSLNSPFGMALVGNDFYVANTDAVVRFRYRDGATRIAGPGTKVADLPGGTDQPSLDQEPHREPRRHAALRDGRLEQQRRRERHGQGGAAAPRSWRSIRATGATRVFASGLRNPNGLAWQPQSGALWTAVNERDELGSDLVPDYMTSVRDGGFYGWPYSYYGQHVDERVQPPRPDLVAQGDRARLRARPAHRVARPRVLSTASCLPQRYRGGAFVGQHGSWNRKPRSGYKVIFVPFADGRPAGQAEDVLTGFVDSEEHALGRPVGVAVDGRGALLVADDVGNRIWRVTPGEQLS